MHRDRADTVRNPADIIGRQLGWHAEFQKRQTRAFGVGNVNEMLRAALIPEFKPQPPFGIFMYCLQLTVRGLNPCFMVRPIGEPNDPDGQVAAIRGEREAFVAGRSVP